MDPLLLMLLVVVGGTLCLALLAGAGDRRAGTRLTRERATRDHIADGAIKRADVAKTLNRENARREERGARQVGQAEFESMVVADARTRRKVWLWKGRR
jgi:hypothetical protein